MRRDAEFGQEQAQPSLLAALHGAGEPPRREFAALAEAAAVACGAEMALISLDGGEHQHFIAAHGLAGIDSVPSELAFCPWTLRDDALFEVPDAQLDPRFASHPHVVGGLRLRSYAGWPLRLADGRKVGVLCVLGRVSHRLAESEQAALRSLADAAGAVLDAATQRVDAQHALQELAARNALAADGAGVGLWELDLAGGTLRCDARAADLQGLPTQPTQGDWRAWLRSVVVEDRRTLLHALRRAQRNGGRFVADIRQPWADASVHHLRLAGRLMTPPGAPTQARGLAASTRLMGACWDVSAQHDLAARLEVEHELLKVTLQSIGDALITADAQGRVNWLNPVAEQITGWSNADAYGRPIEEVFTVVDELSGGSVTNPVRRCLAGAAASELPGAAAMLVARDGRRHGIEDTTAPIRSARGAVLGAVLVFRDVTEQRRLAGEMSYRASHDALTGLVNRAEFDARLARVLEEAHAQGGSHALLYIDLDQFKLVNDACGHSAGDLLLQQVAQLLLQVVRARDTLARLGGDEFGVILERCSTEQARRVANLICERIEAFRFVHDTQRLRIGASIGLVPVDARWRSTAAVMQAADTACYAAKEAGRNRLHEWFDTDQAIRNRNGDMRWATRLEAALEEDRFVLFGQRIEPIDSAGTAAPPLHAETLLRMVDADGSLVPPGVFLPAAERFHLASRIDRWVLAQAVRALRAAPALGAVDTLCINLSGQSIGDRAFHRQAVELLHAAGGDICRRICLEITETAAITNMADATLFVEQVRALGVRMALDDFGAGTSSFGYLKQIKVDLLKIDGQFIKDLLEDPLDGAAVRSFVDVARVIGVKTVAEHVDRQAVLDHLRVIGVDFAQGYLLHKPEPLAHLLGLPSPPLLPVASAAAALSTTGR